MNCKQSKTNAGFSLLELLVSMVIVLIMLGFVSTMISGIQREFVDQQPRMDALNNAGMSMDTMVRVVRMAGAKNPACPAAFTVIPLTPSSAAGGGIYRALRIQADWNAPDCNLTGVDEDVTFSANNGIFYLDAAQSEPFAEGVQALRFTFFDNTNTLIADAVTNASLISYVQIEIDTNDDTQTTLNSGVSVRSR